MSIDLKRGIVSEDDEVVKKAKIVKKSSVKIFMSMPNDDDYKDITKDQFEQHFNKVYESEGFDADPLDHIEFMGIRALCDFKLAEWMEDLIRFCTAAIKEYNSLHVKSLEFVSVRKANFLPWAKRSRKLFITFDAKDSSGSRAFQAKVYDPHWLDKKDPGEQFIVEFCREEPTSAPS